MKQMTRLLALLLCLATLLMLAGCKQSVDESLDTEADSTEQAPTQSESDAPISAAEAYAEAVDALLSQDALCLQYTLSDSRTLADTTYSQSVTATLHYKGLQGTLQAEKSGEVTFNDSEPIAYDEQFIDGVVYSRFDELSATQVADQQSYLDAHYPINLASPDNYGEISAEETADGTLYTLSAPQALEPWLGNDQAELLTAQATALVADGQIRTMHYQAEYTQGTTQIVFDLTAEIETSTDFSFSPAPTDAVEYVPLSDVRIPWAFEWAIDNLYQSATLSASIQQVIQSEATGVMTFQTQLNSSDTGEYLADIQHDVAFYSADTSTTYHAVEHQENGTYTYTVDGTLQAEEAMDDTQLLNGIYYYLDQYMVLSSWITEASVQESDGIWLIHFSSTDPECGDYIKYSTSNEFYGSSTTLDDIASAYQTNSLSGTLCIDLDNMLPTAYTMDYSGTHTIEEADYVLSHNYTIALCPADPDSYYNIKGAHASEAAPETPATPLFYHVTDAAGHELWLLGTIHVGDARTAYLPQAIYDAFDAADALAVEVNLNAVDDSAYTTEMLNATFYENGETISTHIAPALYDAALPAMQATGSYQAEVEYMKASLWQNTLSNFYLTRARTLRSSCGVDQRLLDRAQETEKKIMEIEGFASQYWLLLRYSDALQALLLDETVSAGYYGAIQELSALYALWCEGNEARLTEALIDKAQADDENAALYEEYNRLMQTERNSLMHAAAVEYLQSEETVFYAVGLAHLLGEDGLVASLRAAGYAVERVNLS